MKHIGKLLIRQVFTRYGISFIFLRYTRICIYIIPEDIRFVAPGLQKQRIPFHLILRQIQCTDSCGYSIVGQRCIQYLVLILHFNLIGFIYLIWNWHGIGIGFKMTIYQAVSGSFLIPVMCHIMPSGLCPGSDLHNFRWCQRILIIKNGL